MQEIIRTESPHGPAFIIVTEEGNFEISFQGTLDLYWSYCFEGSILDTPPFKKFIITRENYFLYSLFDELYNDIKNINIFKFHPNDVLGYMRNADLKKELRSIKRRNEEIETKNLYNRERLFKNGVIEWHHDEFPYEDGSVLKIEPHEEGYEVTIEKSKRKDLFFITYSVRIRNSGSRYEYYNIPFMRMYQQLVQGHLDNPQISIDEYLSQKKLKKKPE